MSGNVRVFRWDARRERAAVLVAEDDLPLAGIGAAVGVNERTVRRWCDEPEFAARVAAPVAALEAAILRLAIA